MIRFECDYNTGAHPAILQRLLETNEEQTPGYGEDPYCESARKRIRALCQNETVDVHFLMGGTQTNLTVIAAVLRPWQGVLCADTGHINVHESGAIEAEDVLQLAFIAIAFAAQLFAQAEADAAKRMEFIQQVGKMM